MGDQRICVALNGIELFNNVHFRWRKPRNHWGVVCIGFSIKVPHLRGDEIGSTAC
jgi:hypothetical protein